MTFTPIKNFEGYSISKCGVVKRDAFNGVKDYDYFGKKMTYKLSKKEKIIKPNSGHIRLNRNGVRFNFNIQTLIKDHYE